MKEIKNLIQKIVDNSNDKKLDKVFLVIGIVLAFITLTIVSINTYSLINGLEVLYITPIVYALLIMLSIGYFYFTLLGNKTSKSYNRKKIYIGITINIIILFFFLLVQVFNVAFVGIMNKILLLNDIPVFLLETNIKIMSVFVPILLTLLIFKESLAICFKKEYSDELLEYSLDILKRNVSKMDDTTVDIKICKSLETGEDVILTEKNSFRHSMKVGSSGSGKTALSFKKELYQLFYKKAYLREELKKLSFEGLEKGICQLTMPVTNKFLNENFSMKYITYKENKRKLFLEHYKKFIVGVRKGTVIIYDNVISDRINIEIPRIEKDFIVTLSVYTSSDMIINEYKYELKFGENKIIKEDKYTITIKFEEDKPNVTVSYKSSYSFKFKVKFEEKSDSKIIFKDLGITTVAPDNGLPTATIEMAEKNNIHIYKIDPSMEEINKGDIAAFNPLLVGEPEKCGDIVSSILIAMEQSTSKGNSSNAYYTNASIRAVRNIIIILKVMHEKINGEKPTLIHMLNIFNDFDLVMDYVDPMKADEYLRTRWSAVIDYFETCFYPQPLDNQGNPIKNKKQGSKRQKTMDAVQGMVNQLDNLLGREEVKYILCNKNESLNLSEVLENGDCIAIATRQAELGEVLGKAFALFFILSMQNAVLGRYSEDENPEIPQFLKIDEFPFYINDNTKVFFTFSRKYKCAVDIAIQNLAQLSEENDIFRQIILTNCTTKLLLPGANVEDRAYFAKHFGMKKVFETQTAISKNPILTEKAKYTESIRGGFTDKNKVSEQDISELEFKKCYYSFVNSKGKSELGKGILDFLNLKEEKIIKLNEFDFEKYNEFNIYKSDKKLNRNKDAMNGERISENKNVMNGNEIENNTSSDSEIIASNSVETANAIKRNLANAMLVQDEKEEINEDKLKNDFNNEKKTGILDNEKIMLNGFKNINIKID